MGVPWIYISNNEINQMTDLNTRLIASITKMLGAANGVDAHDPAYAWVWKKWGKASTAELAKMQGGWMASRPEIFNAHGIYVL